MSKSKAAVSKPSKADGQRQGAAKEARIQANGKPGESSAMGSGKGKGKSVATTDADAGEHDDELMESLRKHDASFTALLSLIPAHLYLAAESDSEEGESVEGDAGRPNGQKRKQDVQADANERKARIKEAKRAKFDPDNHKNAIEVQKEREAAKQERRKQEEQQSLNDISFTLDAEAMHAGDTDEEGDDDSMPDDSEDDGESYETLPTSAKGSEDIGGEKPSISSPLPGAASTPGIFDLRARLQAKIQGLQAQRRNAQLAANGNAASDDSHAGSLIGDDESTASTKDELLEERRKKRGEMRDNRRRQAKERKRAEREQFLRGGAAKKSTGSGNDNKAGGAPALFVSPKANGHSAAETAKDAPAADYAFSAMQFDGHEHSILKRHKHALPSDPKAALAILDARKRKEEARQSKRDAKEGSSSADADAGEDRSSLLKWGKAEAAAQGIKIRDDEALLRKALKKREKQKAKSTKEWKKRGKDIVQQQAARQKKRRDNIAARKDKKTKGGGAKSSSSSSAKVKGYSAQKGGSGSGGRGGAKAGGKGKKAARPGFEGRSRSFGGGGGGGKSKKGGK